MAPAAFAYCSTFSSGQPASSPWHSDPPKESPAPSPFSGVIGSGGTSTRLVRVRPSTPLGPFLTTASSTPASSRASAARSGSDSPIATSHSSRLPTATVTCGSTRCTCSRAASAPAQNIGR